MKGLVLVAIIFFQFGFEVTAQELKLPSNPLDGRIVFEDKGCIFCHSLSGYGGNVGPDLTRKKYYGSFLELASIIWNHIPEMDRKYRELKFERPRFNEREMLDLIYFIYYLRYLGEPGSVSSGQKLLTSKGCLNCHKVTGEGNRVAPDFARLKEYASPLYMAQTMWNHGPSMQEKMKELNMAYPTLSGENIADITAYIRQATLTETEIKMSPGNPSKGKIVFKRKGCFNCHKLNDADQTSGSNLSKIKLNESVTDIAAKMWNHSPSMIEYMKDESVEYPQFDGNEMADLIAYLYFGGFEDPPGNPVDGELIYIEKGCASCHDDVDHGIAPDLSNVKTFNSRIKILQRMWNHASQMEDLLLIQNNEWPELTTKEMQDLFAYISSLSQKE